MTRLGDILDLDKADEALASREIRGIACDSRKVAPGDVFFIHFSNRLAALSRFARKSF